jgi:glycosyltransferase involved in cell wall biosynthesis
MTTSLRPKVAYLVNQYPKVSHSFIRREIIALEAQGWDVHRFAARGWEAELPDAADRAEAARTEYMLRRGAGPLLAAAAAVLLASPARFFAALRLAFRMMVPSDRPFPVHLVYLLEACWLARALKSRGIGHVHAHFGTNPAAVAMLTRELSGISYSFTVHGPDEFDTAPLIHLAEKIRRAAFVVAISSYGRSQLFRLVEQEHWSKIQVVHCGVDRQFAALDHVKAAPVPRLACVGRLSTQKGQLLLVSAAAQLVQDGLDFELVLVGDGEMRAEIERSMHVHGLQNVVTITGWADAERVRAEILAARAHVLPSFMEGLPVVLMEAMALGRPVISTYVAGIPELVREGENGWLVPAGDVTALADAMRACLAADEASLERMGAAARARALARHDVDREASKLASLFSEVSSRAEKQAT